MQRLRLAGTYGKERLELAYERALAAASPPRAMSPPVSRAEGQCLSERGMRDAEGAGLYCGR